MLGAALPKRRVTPNSAIRKTVQNLGGSSVVGIVRARSATARLLFAVFRLLWWLVHDVGPVAAELKVVGRGIRVLKKATPLPIASLLDLAFEFAEEAFVVVHGMLDEENERQVRA